MWSGSKPGDIVHTLLDSLLRMLDLDFVYVSLTDLVDAAPSETVKVAQSQEQSQEQMFRPRELCAFLNRWLEMTHKNVISRNAVTLEARRFHSCPGLSGFSVKSGNRSWVWSKQISREIPRHFFWHSG